MKPSCKISFLVLAALAALPANAGAAVRRVRAYRASLERWRENSLQRILCADRALDCSYVRGLFSSPELVLFVPRPIVPAPIPERRIRREGNPYLTERFGLLTPESLERCRDFVAANRFAFDAARVIYGVPEEIICGHLRIETNFGMPTPLSPHPLGAAPAFNRLVALYVRRSSYRRRRFAVLQLEDLISAAEANGWDLFKVPGSATGAIGLLQFEPSNFYLAVDGDGDGTINLFSPDDAILSLAHYLAAHGWDGDAEDQDRAIYSYYGPDPHKYYMKAVLAYAKAEKAYLADHPISEPAASPAVPPLGSSDAK